MRPSILSFLIILLVSCNTRQPKNTKLSGQVFGTSYSVIYDSHVNYEKQFDSLFYVINKSMSTYIENSDISKINRNETIQVDEHFTTVFKTSKIIYHVTSGAFDPTIGAVVNAWDFGPEGKIVALDSIKIDSLMLSVGLDKVKMRKNAILKDNLHTYLDFNAIAKGYAVDVIAEFLESRHINDYLVEIGGEIRCKGMNNEKKANWMVGIDKPNFDGSQSVIKAIKLQNEAMATSGTYRKFKLDAQGNRYAHIIDTKTGYPSKTNVLSVSVIANDCMTADAYATAFQAMGIDKVSELLKTHPELKVFFIFENDNQELETLALNGFPEN
jgi:thiamine biosynthesis lipoprotein